MHRKIEFWGFEVEKCDTLTFRPPRKSISSENRHLVQKRHRYVSPSVLQSFARNHHIKKNKLYDNPLNIIFHPFAGGPCWANCSTFWHVGWHPRRNHAYRILSRSRRAYGATGSKIGVFLFIFKPLLPQCFALPCYTVMN